MSTLVIIVITAVCIALIAALVVGSQTIDGCRLGLGHHYGVAEDDEEIEADLAEIERDLKPDNLPTARVVKR